MEKYVYIIVFLLFIPIFFFILRAMELEKKFKQGHITEIYLAYILFSMILAYLTTKSIQLLFSFIE
ncbi:MAG: DUF1146 domain-containing protein [Acholeplasmatales bacterium]|nr:DUF1146 domain-containing protein [Acholeplasmatales bacterium]